MLFARSLPPPFLLPAWNARQLRRCLQRAYKSDKAVRNAPKSASQRKRFPSLFEELFPEETASQKLEQESKEEKLPAFEWLEGRQTVSPHATQESHPKNNGIAWPSAPAGDALDPREGRLSENRELSVLVLNCASNILEESDFFRLSPKGEHLEGWTSGIVKVIPGRDNQSLEALGHYFIVFSSDAAAQEYLKQTVRLHKISKAHNRGWKTALPLPSTISKEGEDLQAVLRGFTLVPGHGQLFLRPTLRPYRPAMARLLKDGGPPVLANLRRQSENMVLLSVDNISMGLNDLRDEFKADGKRRNLHWGLAGHSGDIIRLNVPGVSDSVDQYGSDEAPADIDAQVKSSRRSTQVPKFIVSFKNTNEARRFVREWHRLPLPSQRGDHIESDAISLVNAEILW